MRLEVEQKKRKRERFSRKKRRREKKTYLKFYELLIELKKKMAAEKVRKGRRGCVSKKKKKKDDICVDRGRTNGHHSTFSSTRKEQTFPFAYKSFRQTGVLETEKKSRLARSVKGFGAAKEKRITVENRLNKITCLICPEGEKTHQGRLDKRSGPGATGLLLFIASRWGGEKIDPLKGENMPQREHSSHHDTPGQWAEA